MQQTIGAMHALWETGKRIPEDISVLSLDDVPLGDFLRPRLTRVQVALPEMGAVAVDELLRQIAGEAPRNVSIPIAVEMVEGDSTAPPGGVTGDGDGAGPRVVIG
jgi:LacI family transcriptional regulator